ncbi:MAG: CRISPR-associated endonuclease Cas2 [Patescibacteria group bacterium]
MGKLEKESKARSKKQNIKKIILSTIYGVGMLSVAILAPNAVSTIMKLTGGNFKNKNYRINRAIRGLINEGLIVFENTTNGKFARLTPKGQKLTEMAYAGELTVNKPPKWDGKWRVVIYDLRENKRMLRDKFRSTLAAFGFIKLQNSVWVYPYDCEDLIALIKADFRVGKEILYLIADSVENDRSLKKYFNLS